jgi:molecular chaperone GrpE
VTGGTEEVLSTDSPDVEPVADDDDDESAVAVIADEISVEDLVDTLETVTRERDDYLDSLQRRQAEFDNFRKRTMAEHADRISAGLSRLAEALLPVLDACDAAVGQGDESVAAVQSQLMAVLAKEGLERIDAVDAPFDPAEHDAVIHEAGDGEQVVVEEMRAGYRWAGRVIRPAMVKVRG